MAPRVADLLSLAHNLGRTLVDPLRWPVALGCTIFMLPALISIVAMADQLPVAAIVGGMLTHIMLRPLTGDWRRSFARTAVHEFAHLLASLLTVHAVTELGASREGEGLVRYSCDRPGPLRSWVVTAAPYCPLLLIGAGATLRALPDFALKATLLGYILAWFFEYLLYTVGRHQSDLKRLGWTFTWLFVPGSNVIGIGLTLALFAGGAPLTIDFLAGTVGFGWAP